MSKKLTRRALKNLPRESIHTARNWSKADVSLAEWPPNSGRQVVIKELRGRSLWYRVVAGRYLLRREWRALRALKKVKGVPDLIARPDCDTIVMEFRAGQTIEQSQNEVRSDAIVKIEKLVQAMHARGITHGDLHGYNILVDESGEIAMIDWATASTFGPRRRGFKAFTFGEWQALDERALAKVKIENAPHSMTPREHDLLLNGGSKIYRGIKQFKKLGEALRGVDAATAAARQEKKRRYEKQLQQFDPTNNVQQTSKNSGI